MAFHVTVVIFESIKEFSENLIFSLLTGLDIWMLFGIIGASDIINIKNSRAIFIHDRESFQCNFLSSWIHFTSDHPEKLIIGNFTTSISIEKIEDSGNLLWIHSNSEIMHTLLEFLFIKRLRSVVISNLELSANRSNTSSSSLGKSFSQVIQKLLVSCIFGNTCFFFGSLWWWSVENVAGLLSSGRFLVTSSSSCTSIFIGPSSGSISLSGSFSEFPSIFHHELEVSIIVNGS